MSNIEGRIDQMEEAQALPEEDGLMNITIRPYQEADCDAVTFIWRSSWQSTGIAAPVTLGELRRRWPEELAKGWAVYVATVESVIAGFLALHGDKIEQLFVAPDCQGCGI
jgi:putative acetyltransferase